jgi:hypothetical protein
MAHTRVSSPNRKLRVSPKEGAAFREEERLKEGGDECWVNVGGWSGLERLAIDSTSECTVDPRGLDVSTSSSERTNSCTVVQAAAGTTLEIN